METTNYLTWNINQLWEAIKQTRTHYFLSEIEKEELINAYLARIEELKAN